MNSTRFKKKISKKIKKMLRLKPAKQNYGMFWQKFFKRHQKEWEQAKKQAKSGPKVLIATSTGGQQMASCVESLLAVALTLRGANVHILLCDALLPACSMALSTNFSELSVFLNSRQAMPYCPKCHKKGDAIYRPLGLPIHFYGQIATPEDIQQANETANSISAEAIPDFRWHDTAVGEHAMAGTLRFFGRGDLEGEINSENVLRRYFEASLLSAFVTDKLFNEIRFSTAAFHHGIYVPMGLIGEVARKAKIKVINWIQAYRKGCFIFSHKDTYHHTMMTEPTDRWEDMSWSPEIENHLINYLKSRWEGTRDWISFHDKPQFDLDRISSEIGVDFSKPTVGMLTNVMWDAQLHYPANAFPNMREWLIQTIGYFADRPELQLLIRVHPAELTGMVPSRQRVVDEIKNAFPTLPDNIFVIPPESRVSTYATMLQCDSVIIYGTKTGVELTSMEIPVIVAGEAWIRNKGITLDARSSKAYFDLLDKLPLNKRLDEATTLRARKYAFHFFFRRMIPVEFFEPTGSWPPFRLVVNNLNELKAGHSKGLDVICDGILTGSDFIYPEERLLAP